MEATQILSDSTEITFANLPFDEILIMGNCLKSNTLNQINKYVFVPTHNDQEGLPVVAFLNRKLEPRSNTERKPSVSGGCHAAQW
jgi:hypothetical protein